LRRLLESAESFLAKIDTHIEERVEQRLAGVTKSARRPVGLSKYRMALAGAAGGSIVAGAPLSLVAWWVLKDAGGNPAPLLVVWVVLLAVYGLAAYRLRRR